MTHELVIHRNKPHAFHLALRKQQLIERIARGRHHVQFGKNMMPIDIDDLNAAVLDKRGNLCGLDAKPELAQPMLDRDFPKVHCTDKENIFIPYHSANGKSLFDEFDDEVCIQQQVHQSDVGVIRKSSGNGASKSSAT